MLRGGTTDKLVLRDWKRQMYEEIYFLGIHLGKRDVSLNGLPQNQCQLIYWWRNVGERLGAEVGTEPLRNLLQLKKRLSCLVSSG